MTNSSSRVQRPTQSKVIRENTICCTYYSTHSLHLLVVKGLSYKFFFWGGKVVGVDCLGNIQHSSMPVRGTKICNMLLLYICSAVSQLAAPEDSVSQSKSIQHVLHNHSPFKQHLNITSHNVLHPQQTFTIHTPILLLKTAILKSKSSQCNI